MIDMEDIEKLCRDFHKKVGLDKSIKIIIEDGNPTESPLWGKSELLKNESYPFHKVITDGGTYWSYKENLQTK